MSAVGASLNKSNHHTYYGLDSSFFNSRVLFWTMISFNIQITLRTNMQIQLRLLTYWSHFFFETDFSFSKATSRIFPLALGLQISNMFKGMSFKLQTSLIDFGKNCPVADAKQLDKTKKAKDYRWIAPEIATGESTPSKASDIYFLIFVKKRNAIIG